MTTEVVCPKHFRAERTNTQTRIEAQHTITNTNTFRNIRHERIQLLPRTIPFISTICLASIKQHTYPHGTIANHNAAADFVQELYLKELKAYKIPTVKDTDSVGQVQTFVSPKTPTSPEESDLANNLKEYESMAVEIEGQDATAVNSSAGAALPDWLDTEIDDVEEAKH